MLTLEFLTMETGCLKMDAVCRMGGTRLLSCVGTAMAGATLLLTEDEGLTGTTTVVVVVVVVVVAAALPLPEPPL